MVALPSRWHPLPIPILGFWGQNCLIGNLALYAKLVLTLRSFYRMRQQLADRKRGARRVKRDGNERNMIFSRRLLCLYSHPWEKISAKINNIGWGRGAKPVCVHDSCLNNFCHDYKPKLPIFWYIFLTVEIRENSIEEWERGQ